jgi:predicted O-methyltransferase YrrM
VFTDKDKESFPYYMNSVLSEVVYAKTCPSPDGKGSVNLLQNTAEPAEGELIHKSIAAVQAKTTLDIGLGYGTSSMFICDALAQSGINDVQHIAIDPSTSTIKLSKV